MLSRRVAFDDQHVGGEAGLEGAGDLAQADGARGGVAGEVDGLGRRQRSSTPTAAMTVSANSSCAVVITPASLETTIGVPLARMARW